MLQVGWTIFFKNEHYEKKILGFMKFHGIKIIIEIIKKKKKTKQKWMVFLYIHAPCKLKLM